MHPLNLRTLLTITAIISALAVQPLCAEGMTKGRSLPAFTPNLKTGDYVWHPEISPAGPVVIIVSLSEQLLYVYRNGVRIGRSTISSGKEGDRTPTGVFTILQKRVKHISTIFHGASMPYMERLTWRGVAIHAGNLPGYPASHACVRLPLEFAQKLYTVTENGTTVIVIDDKFTPGTTAAPGLLFTPSPTVAAAMPGETVWRPEEAPSGPVSIILSGRDQAIFVYRNGKEIGRTPIGGFKVKGSHVYSALTGIDANGVHDWLSTMNVGGHAPNIKKMVKRLVVSVEFLKRTRTLIVPGTTLILTDMPVGAKTQSAPDFDILTTASTR